MNFTLKMTALAALWVLTSCGSAKSAQPKEMKASECRYPYSKVEITNMKTEMERIVALYKGFFYQQHAVPKSKKLLENIRTIRIVVPLWEENGHQWFYEELTVADILTEPVNQRVTEFYQKADGSVWRKSFDIMNKSEVVNAWFIPERLKFISKDSLHSLDDVCENLFEKINDTKYEYNVYKPCPVNVGKVRYFTAYHYVNWEETNVVSITFDADFKQLRKDVELDSVNPLMPKKVFPLPYVRDIYGDVQAYIINSHWQKIAAQKEREKKLVQEQEKKEKQEKARLEKERKKLLKYNEVKE